MARKPARKTEEAAAQEAGAKTEEIIGNTEGENGAVKPADTPDAPAEGHTAAPGGEGEALPADTPDAAPAEPVAQEAEGADQHSSLPQAVQTPLADPVLPMITVICRAKGGRRRVGRRWAEGGTELPASDLTETEIAILRGDPRFSVLTGQG